MSTAAEDRTLILVRHSKAEQVFGKPDHDRELTDRGHRDAKALGEWLHGHGLICDVVVCSTSMRTRQTWEGIEAGGGGTEVIEYARAIYSGGTHGLVVGHVAPEAWVGGPIALIKEGDRIVISGTDAFKGAQRVALD